MQFFDTKSNFLTISKTPLGSGFSSLSLTDPTVQISKSLKYLLVHSIAIS